MWTWDQLKEMGLAPSPLLVAMRRTVQRVPPETEADKFAEARFLTSPDKFLHDMSVMEKAYDLKIAHWAKYQKDRERKASRRKQFQNKAVIPEETCEALGLIERIMQRAKEEAKNIKGVA